MREVQTRTIKHTFTVSITHLPFKYKGLANYMQYHEMQSMTQL